VRALTWLRRVASLLLRRDRVEAELDEEVSACFEITVEGYLESGVPPAAARRRAAAEFGGVEQVKEQVREVRMGALLEQFVQDIRYAVRGISRERRFAAIAAGTLALGIGVNTAVFSVLQAMLIQPLPYDRADRLTLIWSAFEKMGAPRAPGAGPELLELQRRNKAYEGVAGIWAGNGTLLGDPEPEQIKLAQVTSNFFQVLGAHPVLGRAFAPGEDSDGYPKTAVINDALWHSRFGADPAVIGKPLRLGGDTLTVVGVLAPGFRLYFPPDANVPGEVPVFTPFWGRLENRPRDLYFIRFLGRLRPDVTVQQAQSDLDGVAAHLRAGYAEYAAENLRLTASPLQQDAVKDIRQALLALMVGAIFVQMIACVNVANLLLARAAARHKEMAVRRSIGATPARIMRQLLAECGVLAAIGGSLGTALGYAGFKLLSVMRPESLARIDSAGVNPVALVFAAVLSLASALVFAVVPAAAASKLNLIDSLRETGRGTHSTPSRTARSALIVAETAFGFVLLTCAALMIATFFHLQRANPGFDARRALTFEIQPRGDNVEQTVEFVRECERRVRAVPGVESVGAISHLPLDDYPNWYSPYVPEGIDPARAKGLLADHRAVTPGYFASIGARLIAGRSFDDRDEPATTPVVVVDDLLAKTTWPGESAVGKKMTVEHFTPDGFANRQSEVVGVVEHIQHHSLADPVRGQIYVPYTQSAREHLSFVVKTAGDPFSVAGAVRRVLRDVNKDMAISKLRPMAWYVQRAAAPVGFSATVCAVFGALGLILALAGVYSVTSYSVSQRTREVGVRMAVGATTSDIVRLILREGLSVVVAGLLAGGLVASVATRALRSLLFGVQPFDPPVYAMVACILAAAALLACWRPALRASRSSVVDALRLE
jgi:putative ABC transport system permease protein